MADPGLQPHDGHLNSRDSKEKPRAQALTHIIIHGPRAVADEVGQLTPVERTKSGRNVTLRVISGTNYDGLVITKRQDGTLQATLQGKPVNYRLDLADATPGAPLERWVAARLETLTLARHPTAEGLQEACKPTSQRFVFHTMKKRVLSMMLDGEPPEQPAKRAGQILRNSILPRRTKAAVRSATESSLAQCTIEDYNIVAQALRPVEELLKSTPNVAKLYAQSVGHWPEHQDRIPASPGEIVQLVREALELQGMAWRIFCNCDVIGKRVRLGDISVTEIRDSCRTAATANLGCRRTPALDKIVCMHLRHFLMSETARETPWAARAWGNALHRYATQTRTEHQDTTNLVHIHDAIRGHAEDNIAWGPGDWETLVQRADRWGCRARRNAGKREKRVESWKSAVDNLEINGRRFEALTNSGELMQAGTDMSNCLATLIRGCAAGNRRVFVSRRKSREPAVAAEIMLHNGRWRGSRTEGSGNQPPPEGLEGAADQLAQAYNDAEDRAEDRTDEERVQQHQETH